MRVEPHRYLNTLLIGIGTILCAIVFGGSTRATETSQHFYSSGELAEIFRLSPLGPLPSEPTNQVANDPRAAKLGKLLFFDQRFSANGRISCATCHQPAKAFTDGRKLAVGLAVGSRNTPTVLDTAYQQWFFLDGRTDSQWSQALQPLENPREAGSDRLHIAHLIANDPALRQAYLQLFGPLPPLADYKRFPTHARPDTDPQLPVARAWARMSSTDQIAINRVFSNFGKAIAAYERRLVNMPSPFDRYVAALKAGQSAVGYDLSPAAKRGLKLFVGAGNCILCHPGPTFSDHQFHNLGLPLPPGVPVDTGRADGIRQVKTDPFNAAGKYSDRHTASITAHIAFLPQPQSQLGAFKTPTLRNVALTAPYMHDGRFQTLEQVMDFYARGQAASQGRLVGVRESTVDLVPHLSEQDKADLIAFLHTLTSEPLPQSLIEPPAPITGSGKFCDEISNKLGIRLSPTKDQAGHEANRNRAAPFP